MEAVRTQPSSLLLPCPIPTTGSPDQLEENRLNFPESIKSAGLGGAGSDSSQSYDWGDAAVGGDSNGEVMLAVLASALPSAPVTKRG